MYPVSYTHFIIHTTHFHYSKTYTNIYQTHLSNLPSATVKRKTRRYKAEFNKLKTSLCN